MLFRESPPGRERSARSWMARDFGFSATYRSISRSSAAFKMFDINELRVVFRRLCANLTPHGAGCSPLPRRVTGTHETDLCD